jgi:double-stranded uracil-DNA glycosylase
VKKSSRTPLRLRRLGDYIEPGVLVLFVGINPGIRSAAIGHHFAGYSNRFWKLLYDSGLVPRPLSCEDDKRLPEWRYGMTNLVPRATSGIGDLQPEDYAKGRTQLLRKIRLYRPRVVALVGVTLYRTLFKTKKPSRGDGARTAGFKLGLQADTLSGVSVFVLPNPSGRNANYTYREMLSAFCDLKEYLHKARRRP